MSALSFDGLSEETKEMLKKRGITHPDDLKNKTNTDILCATAHRTANYGEVIRFMRYNGIHLKPQ